MQKFIGVTCVLLGLVMLQGCDDSNTRTAEESLKRAVEQRAAGNARAAVIEAKNVLQKNPKSTEARLLLAKIYLDVGDGASAAKEADRAEEFGANPLDILTVRGKAWLLQQKPKSVLDNIKYDPDAPAAARTVILELHGEALRRLGRLKDAEKQFEAARAAYRTDINEERPHLKITEPPESVTALVGLANIAIAKKDWDIARERLERALSAAPGNADSLATIGLLEFQNSKFAEAESAYQKAFDAKPYFAEYQLRVAHAQVAQKKYEEGIENLNAINKAFPNHVLANYLRGLSAYQLEDYETAELYLDKTLNVNGNYLPAILISGANSYALGKLELANSALTRYLSAVPNNSLARQLLAAAQLKLNKPGDAFATLRPIVDDSTENITLLRMVGAAAIQSGELQSGSHYLDRAIALRPNDEYLRAHRALTNIAVGHSDEGLRELEDAISRDPALVDFVPQLFFGYLRKKDYAKAIETARNLQQSKPENPMGFILEGLVGLSRNDLDAAQTVLEKALAVAPGDPTAAHNLALVHLERADLDKAAETYGRVLERSADHVQTQLRLARVERATGRTDKARDLLEKALGANPDYTPARTELARMLIETGDPAKALSVAREGLRNAPDNLALLETLGTAQIETSRPKEAVNTFTRLVELAPSSLAAQAKLARAAFFAGNAVRAKEALDAILAKQPEHQDTLAVRVQLAIAEKDFETAKEKLAVLRKLEGTEVLTANFDTNLALLEGRPDDAIEALKRLQSFRKLNIDAVRLAEILWATNRREEAIAALREWLEIFPNDPGPQMLLGQYHMALRDWNAAQSLLEGFVARSPDNVVARNNLAYVLLRKGDIAAARAHAVQANKLAPNDPVPMDTLGEILLAEGNAVEAEKVLRRAVGRVPQSPTMRFHLARALAALGRKDEARTILEKVLAENRRFEDEANARSLLDSVRE